MNSCRKGKVGEREFAEYLRVRGVRAKRGQQHKGGEESPDVVSEMGGVHWEVKRTERLLLADAVAQARRDAEDWQIPVVAWRRNRGEWVAILPMSDLLELLKTHTHGG